VYRENILCTHRSLDFSSAPCLHFKAIFVGNIFRVLGFSPRGKIPPHDALILEPYDKLSALRNISEGPVQLVLPRALFISNSSENNMTVIHQKR